MMSLYVEGITAKEHSRRIAGVMGPERSLRIILEEASLVLAENLSKPRDQP